MTLVNCFIQSLRHLAYGRMSFSVPYPFTVVSRSFSNHFIAVSTTFSDLNVSCKMMFASFVLNNEPTSASPVFVMVVAVMLTLTVMLWEEPLNCGWRAERWSSVDRNNDLISWYDKWPSIDELCVEKWFVNHTYYPYHTFGESVPNKLHLLSLLYDCKKK